MFAWNFSKDNTGIQESVNKIIMNLNKILLIRNIGYVTARGIFGHFMSKFFIIHKHIASLMESLIYLLT